MPVSYPRNVPPDYKMISWPASGKKCVVTVLVLSFLSFLPLRAQDALNLPAGSNPWKRIVMIGASVSAGFIESEPFGGTNTLQYRLSRYLDAALIAPHEPTRNLATAMFFYKPERHGKYQLEQAIAADPTLVVGIDFLFWFCYGEGATDAERLDRFEKGLKLLEPLKCPLIVGDLPDASAAVNRMLRPDQMPALNVLATANERLKEWAEKHPNVVVVPLSTFLRSVLTNSEVNLRNVTLPRGETRSLIQSDRLHPSPRGCAVIALALLDAFQSIRPAQTADEIRWDPKEVFRLAQKDR